MRYLEDSQKLIIILDNDAKLLNISKQVPYYNELISNIGIMEQQEILDYLQSKLPIKITGVDLLQAISKDSVFITDKQIFLNGVPVNIIHEELVDDVLSIYNILMQTNKAKTNFKHLEPFIRKVMQNSFITDKKQLADYLANDDFEITEDGYLLAYKSVQSNLTSHYDGKTKHDVGTIVEVKNYDCNANNLCSTGLHFATKSYISRMYDYDDSIIVLVKIDPADIIAIPKEADNTKGRCIKYEVVEVFSLQKKLSETKTQIIANEVETRYQPTLIKDVKLEKKETRTEQTKRLMKEYKNNKEKVAEIMGISISTVERNMRRK